MACYEISPSITGVPMKDNVSILKTMLELHTVCEIYGLGERKISDILALTQPLPGKNL